MRKLSCTTAGITRLLLVAVLSTSLAGASPVPAWPAPLAPEPGDGRADSIHDAVDRIPILAEVSVRLLDGSRLKGLVRAKTRDSLTIGPRRGNGPNIVVPLSSIKTIEMRRPDEGIGVGKAIVVGIAAGTAAFVTLLLILLSNAGA